MTALHEHFTLSPETFFHSVACKYCDKVVKKSHRIHHLRKHVREGTLTETKGTTYRKTVYSRQTRPIPCYSFEVA